MQKISLRKALLFLRFLNELNNEEVVIAMRTLGRLIGSCAMTPLLLGTSWDVKLYFAITHSDKFIKNWDGKTALSLESQEGILGFLEYGYETEAEQMKSHPGLALATAIIAKEEKRL